jgi:RimJ/RimL family protein N-acetyltransferase
MSCPPLHSLEIPTLETPRLRLRAHTAADFPHSCRLWADPEVIRYTVFKPSTPEEVWSRLLRYFGLWSLLGFGYWVVEEKSTGAFVGEVGLCNFHRELDPPLGDTPEIGWTLLPQFHGKGYATEAAQAAIHWATQPPLAATEISCIIHAENAGSLRVAAKCGFTPRHLTTYKDNPTLILYADLKATER